MTRVMITGASTPLGIALAQRLLNDARIECILAVGHHVDAPLPELAPRLRYERVNLAKTRHLHTLLFGPAREMEIDTVVDVALHRRPDASCRDLHALNVEATREILALCERHPSVRRFVLRSHAEAYDLRSDLPSLITEEHPLNLSPDNPLWLRARIEADLSVCARMGLAPLSIAVLRCAECLAYGVASQLYDYLSSRVCLRPLGFDPILNVLSMVDLVEALLLAITSPAQGVFNIPGADTMPLSVLIEKWGRRNIPLPSPILGPAYALRELVHVGEFRYAFNRARFHLGGVLDGRRARECLGFVPKYPIEWP